MLYTLCYFENYFCLKFVHGDLLRLDLRNRSSKIELKKTSFSFAPFHGFKNDFALRQLFHCKKQLKKKERKKYNEDTSWWRVCVKRRVYLNYCYALHAFLFFGLLKQVNIAVESKTIGVIFPPFFVSVIFCFSWAKILKQKSLSAHSLSEKEKWVWMVWNCLRKPALFFFRLPTSRALTFVADLSLILAHTRRQCSKINGGAPFTNWEYWPAFEKPAHKFYS